MRFITCHRGQLQHVGLAQLMAGREYAFSTGIPELDDLAPAGGFARGAVHEILSDPAQGEPLSFALLLARAACDPQRGDEALRLPGAGFSAPWKPAAPMVWCDPARRLYPPALAAAGVSLERLFILRPTTPADLIWTIAESLRCKGVGATVAGVSHLSRIQARRLQLAAESGGGVGLLLSPGGGGFSPLRRRHAMAGVARARNTSCATMEDPTDS